MAGRDTPDANMMEIITRGSFDHQEAPASRPSTTQSLQSASQLSLEYLPPEAPYFTLVGTKLEELTHHSSQGDDGVEQGEGFDDEDSQCSKEPDVVDVGAEVSELYERVVKLSGDIRNTMEQSLNMRASHAKSTVPQHNIASNGRTEENNSDASELPTDDDPSPRSPQAPPTNSTTPTTTTAPADQSHSSLFGEKSDTPPPQFADPKVRKAYERMLRLDERLAALGRREREVKRQRKLLEQEMNKPDSGEGSVLAGENEMVSPVFRTQPNEPGFALKEGVTFEPELDDEEGGVDGEGEVEEGGEGGGVKGASSTAEESLGHEEGRGRKRKKRDSEEGEEVMGTNFIKRNIELVSDAGALVMMTKAEKQRLEELMEDETNITDIVDGEEKALCPVGNMSTPFALEEKDLERMRELDSQLQAILPIGYWDTLSCASSASDWARQLPPDTPDPDPTNTGVVADSSSVPPEGGEGEGLGEQREGTNHVHSEMEQHHHMYYSHGEKERLKAIDEKLCAIHEEGSASQDVRLNNEVLSQLLRLCRSEQNLPTSDTHPLLPPPAHHQPHPGAELTEQK